MTDPTNDECRLIAEKLDALSPTPLTQPNIVTLERAAELLRALAARERPPETLTALREKFEEWATSQDERSDLEKYTLTGADDGYIDESLDCMWEAWKASARAIERAGQVSALLAHPWIDKATGLPITDPQRIAELNAIEADALSTDRSPEGDREALAKEIQEYVEAFPPMVLAGQESFRPEEVIELMTNTAWHAYACAKLPRSPQHERDSIDPKRAV